MSALGWHRVHEKQNPWLRGKEKPQVGEAGESRHGEVAGVVVEKVLFCRHNGGVGVWATGGRTLFSRRDVHHEKRVADSSHRWSPPEDVSGASQNLEMMDCIQCDSIAIVALFPSIHLKLRGLGFVALKAILNASGWFVCGANRQVVVSHKWTVVLSTDSYQTCQASGGSIQLRSFVVYTQGPLLEDGTNSEVVF
jgi:hypothetical protein